MLLLLFLAEQWTDFTVIFASCWGDAYHLVGLSTLAKPFLLSCLERGLCSSENLTLLMRLLSFSFPSLAKTLKVAVAGRFAWQMEAGKGHGYETG